MLPQSSHRVLKNKRAVQVPVLFGLMIAVLPFNVDAADNKVQKGDAIEVQYLGAWREATAVNTNARGEVMAEFEFAGRNQQRVFKQNQVRLKYEIGAVSKLRTWTDATGQFKIKAVLLSSDGETAKLRKPDLSEIDVPVDKLSELDKSMIARLTKPSADGSTAPGATGPAVPLHPRFADAETQPEPVEDKRTALQPDPLPGYITIEQGGTAFGKADFHEGIAAVIAIGGPDSWLLAATKNAFDKPGRLIWISTAKNEAKEQQILPAGELVLDYHAPSHRLLTHASYRDHEHYGTATVLTLWEVLPTDKEVKPILRWDVTPDKDQRAGAPWGRIVDGNIVVHRFTKDEFVGWDTDKKQALYHVRQEAFFDPDAVISPGRKQLFIPNDKSMRVFDTTTGQLLSFMPVNEGVTGIAVSSDGTKAATLGRSKLTVWDLTSATAEPQVYQAESIGSPFGSQLAWVGDDRILASRHDSNMFLYSIKHKLTIWNYQTDLTSRVQGRGKRLREVVSNHLVYAASVREGTKSGFAVGAVSLPGPSVDEATAVIDPDSLLILKPGSEVKLEVATGGNDAQVRAALEKEIEENGWKLSPSATATLRAEMGQSPSQTITYRSWRGGGEQTVTVAPYYSRLKLMIGDSVAWQSGTSSGGAPSSITLREGETAQSKIDAYAKPNPGFFDRVDVPEKISDPAKRNGLGTTKITNRGLVVESAAGTTGESSKGTTTKPFR